MATITTPVRLDETAANHFKGLADKDDRPFAGYLRLVLETVASKNLDLQDLKKLEVKK